MHPLLRYPPPHSRCYGHKFGEGCVFTQLEQTRRVHTTEAWMVPVIQSGGGGSSCQPVLRDSIPYPHNRHQAMPRRAWGVSHLLFTDVVNMTISTTLVLSQLHSFQSLAHPSPHPPTCPCAGGHHFYCVRFVNNQWCAHPRELSVLSTGCSDTSRVKI